MSIALSANKTLFATDDNIVTDKKDHTFDFEDVVVKETSASLIRDDRLTTFVVYNPFNHESLLAAAILRNTFSHLHVITYNDIIPENMDMVIWLGVKKLAPSSGHPFSKKVKHICFDGNQPYYTTPRKLSTLKKMMGQKELTKEEMHMNAFFEYVNGDVNFISGTEDLTHATLIDKVLFEYDIADVGKYGYRYLSTLSPYWSSEVGNDINQRDILTEDIEAAYFATLRSAEISLEQDVPFHLFQANQTNTKRYRDEIAGRFKVLSKKVAIYKTLTTKGKSEKIAVASLPPDLYYIAYRHFTSAGIKVLNITNGLNGRYFTGNVRMSNGTKLGEKIEYID